MAFVKVIRKDFSCAAGVGRPDLDGVGGFRFEVQALCGQQGILGDREEGIVPASRARNQVCGLTDFFSPFLVAADYETPEFWPH